MNNAELIERLCALLAEAADIIREQQTIIALHGIELPKQIEDRADEVLKGRDTL